MRNIMQLFAPTFDAVSGTNVIEWFEMPRASIGGVVVKTRDLKKASKCSRWDQGWQPVEKTYDYCCELCHHSVPVTSTTVI